MGNDLQPSRIAQLLETLNALTQELIDLSTPVVLVARAPSVVTVENQSTEIVSADVVERAAIFSQLNNKEMFLAFDFPAVVGVGFRLLANANLSLVIPAGMFVNAITLTTDGDISFQVFNEAS